MKDAARLLAYFAAILLIGAWLAPILFWAAHTPEVHQLFPFLARYDFEKFFHRALLVAAIVLLWPLLRALRINHWRELGLTRNQHWSRDLFAGFLLAAIPLLCCGAALLLSHGYSFRNSIRWTSTVGVIFASVFVPVVEELFFRGLLLGILLRNASRLVAIFLTSAFFAILHFLKAPEHTVGSVSWTSGFVSIAHSFSQFREPMLVAGGFATLFLLGWILADARIRTRSLWLPIGLHSGWILVAGIFNQVARREMLALPWLGKNLLIGIVPLTLGFLTWVLLRAWLKHAVPRAS